MAHPDRRPASLRPEPPPPSGLPPELRAAWLTLLLFGISSLLYCTLGQIFFHSSFRRLFPLSEGQERFGDFTIFWHKFQFIHTAAFFTNGFPFSYPAPVALMYNVFLHHAGPHPLVAFIGFSVAAILLPATWFAIALSRHGMSARTASLFVASMLLLSWPAILVIDRGNMEILVWIALASATWAYLTGRGYLAAVLFGLAASLKLFPFVFLGLFLSAREYRRLLVGIASFLLLSVVSLALLGPSIPAAYAGIANGLAIFRELYMGRWHAFENGFDHSLFSLIKAILILGHHSIFFHRTLSLYLVSTAVLGLLLYVFRIRHLPLANQLLIFCISSIFFTAFSGDGTLLHLYYPFALLVFFALRAFRDRVAVPGLKAVLVCLAVLVTPLSYLTTGHQAFEGQVRSLLLGYLLLLALRYEFGPSLEESRLTGEPLFQALALPASRKA